MQIIVEKKTQNPIEFISGFPNAKSDTPTLLSDNSDLESCLKASKEVYKVEWDINLYELKKVDLIIKNKKTNMETTFNSSTEEIDFTVLNTVLSDKKIDSEIKSLILTIINNMLLLTTETYNYKIAVDLLKQYKIIK